MEGVVKCHGRNPNVWVGCGRRVDKLENAISSTDINYREVVR